MGQTRGVPRRIFIKGAAAFTLYAMTPPILYPNTYIHDLPIQNVHDGEWRQPTKSEAARWLANHDFLTQPLTEEGIPLFTYQFDETQYNGYDFSAYSPNAKQFYMGNTCGLAAMATIYKTYFYFKYGSVPNMTIEQLRQLFWDKTFIDVRGYEYPYFPTQDGNLLMNYSAIQPALQLLDPTHQLFETIDLSINFGVRNPQLVPEGSWPKIFEKAHNICSQGGMVFLFGLKYGTNGPAGHFTLMTDAPQRPSGLGLFIDSRDQNLRLNTIANYFDQWEGEVGFMYAFGIMPTFLKDTRIVPKQVVAVPA